MLTVKSDDVSGRSEMYEAIVRGEKIEKQNIPAAFDVMINELNALGLSVERIYNEDSDEDTGVVKKEDKKKSEES